MPRGRILVVEDERVVALDIQNSLTDLGFTVTGVAGTGVEALALAEADRPDLVLMDIRLAGQLDGIVVARQLRDRWNVPVVYLTAHSDEDVVQRAKVTEPLGYIVKPFDDRALYTAVETALFRHEADRMKERGAAWLEDWRADLRRILEALDESGEEASLVPVSTFVNLTLRNIVSALSNIQQLTDAMAERAHSPDACGLMQCPRRSVLEDVIRETITTLEDTRGSFKSRELGALRRRLERVLASSTQNRPISAEHSVPK
jgi:two-component system, response regulator PdtaR